MGFTAAIPQLDSMYFSFLFSSCAWADMSIKNMLMTIEEGRVKRCMDDEIGRVNMRRILSPGMRDVQVCVSSSRMDCCHSSGVDLYVFQVHAHLTELSSVVKRRLVVVEWAEYIARLAGWQNALCTIDICEVNSYAL